MFYETKLVATRPAIGKSQTEIVIDLFKDQFVTDLVFIKIAFDLIDTDILAERFPQICPVVLFDQEYCQWTGG